MEDSIRINEGFMITQSIPVGNTEFVLGVNMKNPDSFVTWQCSNKTDYYWGHYTGSLLKATKDLCGRVMEEVEYQMELAERRRFMDSEYFFLAKVTNGENSAIVEFPTNELSSIIGSIGLAITPDCFYLNGYTDAKVEFIPTGNPVADGLAKLFEPKHTLLMVNEMAKAVFHADWRVYARVEEKVKAGEYKAAREAYRDAVDYSKYLKDMEKDTGKGKKKDRGEAR